MARVNPTRNLVKIILLQLVVLIMSACAHHESPGSDFMRSERAEIVNVEMKAWYVLPDKRTVDAGIITFKVANNGRRVHEFIIIKTTLPLDALPVNKKGLDEKKAGKKVGEIDEIHPGEIKEITSYMAPGSYVLFCNMMDDEDHELVSHYRRGMRVAFTVR